MNELLYDNLMPIIVGISLGLLGDIIQKTRAYSLIAWYNNASPDERIKIDIARDEIANTIMLIRNINTKEKYNRIN